jgi:hypothetical protein
MAVGGVADVRRLAVNEEGLKVIATNGYKKTTSRCINSMLGFNRWTVLSSSRASPLPQEKAFLHTNTVKCASEPAREEAIRTTEYLKPHKKNAPNQSGRFSRMRPLVTA